MSSTAARRIVIGLVLVAVVGWWAVSRMNQTHHYTDELGQGAALERTVLPPLDAAKGGPVALPDPGTGTPAVHYPAQQAAVLRPPAAPPAVAADRVPDGTPQDPQRSHPTGTGGDVKDPMPGTASFDLSLLTDKLPLCDAACVQRVIQQLTGGLPVPPVVPPVVLPVGGTPLN
jgi:hypothetical protein